MERAIQAFKRYSGGCPYRKVPELQRRPVNGLNIEIGQGRNRCILQKPAHWPDGSVLRWLGSGGSITVFGICCAVHCPLKPDFCGCGHRRDNHDWPCKAPGCNVSDCGCDEYGGVKQTELQRVSVLPFVEVKKKRERKAA